MTAPATPSGTVGSAFDGRSLIAAPGPAAERDRRPAPLAGMRIVAVEQYGAGPFGTMYLADLGAEIIKVEDPTVGGDVSRYIPPGQQGEDSLFFEAFNRGKRSVGRRALLGAGQSFAALKQRDAAAIVYGKLLAQPDVPADLAEAARQGIAALGR